MAGSAADSYRSIGPGEAVPNDLVVAYYLDDVNTRIAVARANGSLCAFDDICTCADEGCPLSGGLLDGKTLMCQCHGSQWDITTGAVIRGPATQALNTYDVRDSGGDIQVLA
jgi:3-phenylpropionate/trans-cinnamate dioxygenase ferredoxin component